MAAFSVGNSWFFARRIQFRVKGQPMKEQDWHLKVKGHHIVSVFQDFFTGNSFLQKRSVKEPIGAAMAVFSVGNSWAFARRNRFRVKGQPLKEQDTPLKDQDRHMKEQGPVYTINRSLLYRSIYSNTLKSTRPSLKNSTSSLSSNMRCTSRDSSSGTAISPFALTTRCHGN